MTIHELPTADQRFIVHPRWWIPFVLFLLMTCVLPPPAVDGAAPSRPEQRVRFERGVGNVDYGTLALSQEPPSTVKRPPEAIGALWYGVIPRMVAEPNGKEEKRPVPFAVAYAGGLPQRAWCDVNLNGDLTDDPAPMLYKYPEPSGARSFLADLRWTTWSAGAARAIAWTVRVVLGPLRTDGGVDSFHFQQVQAMLGTVTVAGGRHRALLFDGSSDGLYTRAYGDGVFVDLDDDGRFEADPFSPTFGSFAGPFQIGEQVYEFADIDPEGRAVTIREIGAAPAWRAARTGESAPAFEVSDTGGRRRRLEDYRGHYLALYFWASWCGACTDQAPGMVDLFRRFQPAGLEFLGISYDTDRAAMTTFREKTGESWPTSFSGRMFFEDPVGKRYRANALGHVHLIDPQGRLEGIYNEPEVLARRLADLLPGAAKPATRAR